MHLWVPSGRTVSAVATGVEGGLVRAACIPPAGRGAINDPPPRLPVVEVGDVTNRNLANETIAGTGYKYAGVVVLISTD